MRRHRRRFRAGLAAALLPLLLPATPGARAQGPDYRAPVEAPKPAAPVQPAQGQPSQGQPGPKFPNKDTAKNRQDYEMGTDTGSIITGRDAQTGETVLIHVPPKKNQQPQDVEKPIEVKPVVPLIWK